MEKFLNETVMRTPASTVMLGLLLLAMGMVNYILTSDNPLRFDDLLYQYHCLDGPSDDFTQFYDRNNRIDSFAEAFQSQCNHYMHQNGRFVIHFIVQCFCGFLGKPLFNVCNAVVYILFLYGCLRLLRVNGLAQAIVVVALMWFLLPVQQIFTMSIAFSINYLWVGTLTVYFLLLLRWSFNKEKLGIKMNALLFLFGFMTGNTHEGFMLPLSGALFLYLLFHLRSTPKHIWFLVVGLWIGTLCVVLCPSTLNRGTSLVAKGSSEDISFQFIIYSKRFLLLLIMVLCFWLVAGKTRTVSFLKSKAVLFTAIVLDLMFVGSIPHFSQRMVFPLEMLSVLLIIFLLQEIGLWSRLGKRVCVVLLVMMFVHIQQTIYYSHLVSEEYTSMIYQCLESPDGEAHFSDIKVPKYCSSYVERMRVPLEPEMVSFDIGKKMNIR